MYGASATGAKVELASCRDVLSSIAAPYSPRKAKGKKVKAKDAASRTRAPRNKVRLSTAQRNLDPLLSLLPSRSVPVGPCRDVRWYWTLGPQRTRPVLLGYGATMVCQRRRDSGRLPHIQPCLVSRLETAGEVTAKHAADVRIVLAPKAGVSRTSLEEQDVPALLSGGALESLDGRVDFEEIEGNFFGSFWALSRLCALTRQGCPGDRRRNGRPFWRPSARRMSMGSFLWPGFRSALPRKSNVASRPPLPSMPAWQ